MCNKNGILNLLKSAAKLRRFSANSKKLPQFFFNLYGQTPDLWTNRRNPLKNCPKNRFFRKYLEVSEIIPIFALS